MYKTLTLLAVLLFLKACINENSQLLLFGAKIIDVTNGQILSENSILIQDGIIKKIGFYEDLNEQYRAANKKNVTGKFIVPGLWDSHAHVDQLSYDPDHALDMLSLYTMNGITSIREMGGDWNVIKRLKKASMTKKELPAIYTAGPIFENKAFVDWVAEIDNDPEFKKQRIGLTSVNSVKTKVDSVYDLGVDFFKIRTAPSEEVFFELIKQGEQKGVKVFGHVDSKIDLYDAVNAGIASLEHFDIFQLSGMSESKMDSIVNLMKELNTGYSPTLIYFKRFRIYSKEQQRFFLEDTMAQSFSQRAYVSKSLLNKALLSLSRAEESQVPWKKLEENFSKFAEKIAKEGVAVLAGTDGANGLILPGFSLHEELMLYSTELGMSNLSILQSATINPAKALRIDNLGLIKEGYQGNILVLDGNPLEDVQNLNRIHLVINKGFPIDKKEIEDTLQSIRNKNLNNN